MADRNNHDDELELPTVCDSQPSMQEKLSSSDKHAPPSCVCFTKRCIFALLVYFGFVITLGLQSNTDILHYPNWTSNTRSIMYMSAFWSNVLTQFPGGILASIYPANRIFGISVLCSSFLNFLLPEISVLHTTPVIVIKILQGMFEGTLIPAFYGMLRFWAPPSENSRFVTLIYGSPYAGVLLGTQFTKILTKNSYHWSIPFYIYGAMGIIWFLLWNSLVFEKPASHPTISLEEKTYIEQSLDASESKITFKTIPWRNIFTSMPVYAIIVANFCRSLTFYTIIIFQTLYLHLYDLDFDYIKYAAVVSFLVLILVVPLGGVVADIIRNKNILSTTNVRKVFSCGGLAVQGLLFLVLAYFVKTATEAIIILNIGVAFSGLAITGFNVNHLDIAPRYASILMGLSNGIGMTAAFLSPIMFNLSQRNYDNDRFADFNNIFLIGAGTHLIGIIVYAIFASGERQPWAEPKSSTFSDPENSADEKTQLTSTEPTDYGTE